MSAIDWGFLVPLIVNIVAAYFAYQQVRLMRAQAGLSSSAPKWWLRYWPLGVMSILVVLVWVPYAHRAWKPD